MTFMAWSRHFETGFGPVDRQHRALVDLVNQAAPLLADAGNAGIAQAGHLLDQLNHYAAIHFKDEEQLMQSAGLDPAYLAHHHHTHQGFADAVATMRQQASQEGLITGNELLRFLASWLTFHILAEDQSMARQLRAVASGQPPALAWANESKPDTDAPHAVYTGALIDLFGVVTQRNKSLAAINQRLQETQQQLAQANQVLEERVAQRTRELAQANAQLKAEQAALQASMARLERTQQQLLQSEKMAAVGQLAAGVAHEINNPVGFVNANLASLGTYTQRLLALVDAQAAALGTLPTPPPAVADALSQAQATADLAYLRTDVPDLLRESTQGLQRVKHIVDDLLNFSQSAAEPNDWEWLDLNTLIKNALAQVQRGDAELTLELAPLPLLHGMAKPLEQALAHLLQNACQAVSVGQRVRVSTGMHRHEGRDWVWADIEDTGTGMSEATQRRVFEPFFTTKPVGQGKGLGLTVAWDTVQRHHGNLSVHSTPGVGTTFRCELPCNPALVKTAPPAS